MGKFISILEIVVLLFVNLIVMYGVSLLAVTGNGGGRGMSIVFKVVCFFIASFALVDFVRVIKGQETATFLLRRFLPLSAFSWSM
jgi:hypothetical protein